MHRTAHSDQKGVAVNIERQLELLYEIGTLRNVARNWTQFLGTHCANDLEHTLRVIWIALIIARREGATDEAKIIKMSLVHDLAETRTLDGTIVHRQYITQDEPRALKDALSDTGLEDFLDLLGEYKRRDSIEARIVKDADNLDGDLELKELEQRGHKLPAKLRGNREKVRRELFTESARNIWDAIRTSDPDAWHLSIRAMEDKPAQ